MRILLAALRAALAAQAFFASTSHFAFAEEDNHIVVVLRLHC